MKTLFIAAVNGVFCLSLLSAAAHAQESSEANSQSKEVEAVLPEGSSVSATVVHGIKFPLAGHLSVDLSMAKLYGDRLASTWGVQLEPKYHFSEKSWFGLPIGIYQVSAVSGVEFGGDTSTVVAMDPGFTVGPAFGYDPVYGKFSFRDSIYHFRAGFNVGMLALDMTQVLGSPQIQNSGMQTWSFGAQAGLQVELQFGPKWTSQLYSTSVLQRYQGFDTGQYRMDWIYGLGIGRVF